MLILRQIAHSLALAREIKAGEILNYLGRIFLGISRVFYYILQKRIKMRLYLHEAVKSIYETSIIIRPRACEGLGVLL